MKKVFAALIALCLFVNFSDIAIAQKNMFEKILFFGTGYLTGHAMHESGHILSAKLLGVPHTMEWDWKRFPPLYGVTHKWWEFDSKTLTTISASGFYMEIISSEIILNYGDIRKENGNYNYFLLGWVTMTILNPIMYAIRDRMTPGGWGDLGNIEADSHNRDTTEIFIIAHAIINFIRIVSPTVAVETFSTFSTPNNSIRIAISF